jgi:hypothetical protein
MIEDYRTTENHCLNCGELIDAATPVDGGRAPQTGDISICLDCHHLMVYDADMKVRALTNEEMVEIAGDSALIRAMKALGKFKQWERDKNAAQTPSDDCVSRCAGDAGRGDAAD